MSRFEWDKEKNLVNQRKHGISFEEAATIFDGPVRDSAMIPAESLNKSSFFWGMSQCKLRNAILAANSG